LLYCRYRKKAPSKWLYLPVIFIGIVWAISIHTVTAFLYVGLGGRPFWNSSIVGPRFIASAFTAGPALIILALQIVRRVTGHTPQQGTGSDKAQHPKASRAATLEDMDLLARHLPEVASVPMEARQRCLAGTQVLEIATGETILRQGSKDIHAYLILEGKVVV